MKQTIFLHIGMGKTGTTALQDFFWLNRRALRRLGISYPKYGMVAHAHHLLSPNIPPDTPGHWVFKPVAEWAPRLQRLGADRILLSSELIAWATGVEVAEFCRNVRRHFDLRIVIYLRRQDDVIMANYNQMVKAGAQWHELESILEEEVAQFDYLGILKPWAESVGKDKIIVRPYETRQFYRGDICRDFMHHVFGIDIDGDFELPEADPNPRFSYAAMEYKRHLNRLFQNPAKTSRFNKILLGYSAESRTSAGESLLSPSKRKEILLRSHPANQLIARDYMGREDGILFDQSIQDTPGSWVRPVLTMPQARDITRYIQASDSRAYWRLIISVGRGDDPIRQVPTATMRFFKECIPSEALKMERRRRLDSTRKTRLSRRSSGGEIPLLVISLHFPSVTIDGYEELLERHFGQELVRSYQDRPLSLSGPSRNLDALRKSLQFARSTALLEHDTCVHGHFMPLKFMLPSRRCRTRFVTWMSDPIERLVAHYLYWKGSVKPGPLGGLQHRMTEENWSLETFCFRPELKNLYSKFLWGFPLARFDFIGIAEFYETELRRFSSQVLGRPLEDEWIDSSPPARNTTIDANLRSRIEQYHSTDMALYRRVVKKSKKFLDHSQP